MPSALPGAGARPGRRPTSTAILAAGLLAALPLAGCAAAAPAEERPRASPSASPAPSPSPSVAVPEVPTSDASLGSIATLGARPPARLVLPSLGIDMRVEPEGVDDDGAMALPANAADAGWYRFGPGLGDPAGAVVIAAHVDSWHDGIGPFSRLKDAAPGSAVQVIDADGAVVDYTIDAVRSVGKIDAPMAEVFDRAGAARLTLVTCGGVFDSGTGHYLDNVIVDASPVTG